MLRLKVSLIAALVLALAVPATSQSSYFLGFDRNDYPGDKTLNALHQTFAFTGYWLNNPPGTKANTWISKRQKLEAAGLGFLVLFNGRLYAELKSENRASAIGKKDAQAAVDAAQREGFSVGTIIFLDQEQGGRMLPEQKSYIFAWVDSVTAAGFRAGIYCSGIDAKEEDGTSIVTANDIRQSAGARQISYWVTNDACPPSPGCAFSKHPAPAQSGIQFADVWQFAQSPKRKDVAAGCPANYGRDGSCYPPNLGFSEGIHVDVNTATSSDPSHGRTR